MNQIDICGQGGGLVFDTARQAMINIGQQRFSPFILCPEVVVSEHENPTGFWKYEGDYSIKILSTSPTKHVPKKGVEIYFPEGRTSSTKHARKKSVKIHSPEGTIIIKVLGGNIVQGFGGICFYNSEGHPFEWHPDSVISIYDKSGKLYWQNFGYECEEEGTCAQSNC